MTTRREYFMQNLDEFQNCVWKWRGEKPYTLHKEIAKKHKSYIGKYLCDNMKDCMSCPVTRDRDGYCDDAIRGEWLDAPMGSDPSDLVPEDREAVQKIFDKEEQEERNDD